jgi:hypothetical protein
MENRKVSPHVEKAYKRKKRLEAFSYGIGKHMPLYSDKAKYTFPLLVSEKNSRGVCQTLLFPCGACDAEGDKDRQLSPSLNDPDVLSVRPERQKAAVWLL